jgi:hypothetical protein
VLPQIKLKLLILDLRYFPDLLEGNGYNNSWANLIFDMPIKLARGSYLVFHLLVINLENEPYAIKCLGSSFKLLACLNSSHGQRG